MNRPAGSGGVTDRLLADLREVVGPDDVLTGEEACAPYARDETEDLVAPPDVVVRPRTTPQVSAVMRLATGARCPVTPRGGGTGLSGGALAARGGICLSLERMNRILEIDTGNLMAVVEPGVITEVLHNEVEKHGLFYPPDPASRGSCMIGGNVAENAGGPRAVKYGVTGDWVTGLEAVRADGTVFTTGGKLRKNASGYDLTSLLVGSEGTLAVVTRVTVRLIPLPRHRSLLLACFDRIEDAAVAIAAIFDARVIPSAVELMEGEAWRIGSEGVAGLGVPSDRAAYLLIEVDGMHAEVVEEEAVNAGEACAAHGARDVIVADAPAKQQAIWDARRRVGEAVKRIAPYKEEDTVVPRRQIPDLMEAVRAIVARHGLRAICYGHAGDGNIHVNLLKQDDRTWAEGLDRAIAEIFKAVAALGGKISGEHGIGSVQRRWLPIAHDPGELDLMRAVKRAFDPLGILNPGKIFPDEE